MLSKKTEYAIRALVYISLQNMKERRPLIAEISREIDAPPAFTAKVLQVLSRNKLVSSMKGRGGGFFFDEKNKGITLYDVIYNMEGDGLFRECGFGLRNCSDIKPCPLHDRYKAIREDYFSIVKEETIASLSLKIKDGKAVINNINRIES
ncbi:MAG: Rrf2 family transcriptional regulator [Bacteroidales bacterium]|nr:Rrf2 family transcriptional regulator [Bacteroidales bacterium]